MLAPSRLLVVVLSLAGVLGAAAPCVGQPGAYAGQPGVYVPLPRGGGYVYVPLDPSGYPIGLPGAEPQRPPPVPVAPPSPPAPGTPGVPSAGTGSLIETDSAAGAHPDDRPVGASSAGSGYSVVPVP